MGHWPRPSYPTCSLRVTQNREAPYAPDLTSWRSKTSSSTTSHVTWVCFSLQSLSFLFYKMGMLLRALAASPIAVNQQAVSKPCKQVSSIKQG